MPKKILPAAPAFEAFEMQMRQHGFEALSEAAFRANLRRLRLRAPSPRPGREAGFTFSANGLTVWVWTTWLRAEQRAREVDMGWVVIARGDIALYYARPMLRTKNFLDRLLKWAIVSQWKVSHRPHCPACNALMDIVRGPKLKDRYWRCDLIGQHPDHQPRSYRWDLGLPEELQTFVDTERAVHLRYVAQRIAQGKQPHAAVLRRKGWRRAS